MATISQWSNYDYNGTIFVFGVIDSTLTSNWKNITQVKMSVDSSSKFVYTADIKDIPYFQTNNKNNTNRKVFNINTFTHRDSDTTQYQFSSGTHTCYLRFYYGSSYVSASVSVVVHATLTTPSLSFDEENGIINVSRSTTSLSPRYYIEIRRKNRNVINSDIQWEDKDYIHTVIMKGVEGGKYNEGVPHTGLMFRGESSIAGSSREPKKMLLNPLFDSTTSDSTVTLSSVNEEGVISLASSEATLMAVSNITSVAIDTDVQVTPTSDTYEWYYKFTASSKGLYRFYQTSPEDIDLKCTLYSDSNFSNDLIENDDAHGYMFDLVYYMNSGQTVYIKIFSYTKNNTQAFFRIEKIPQISMSSFISYEIEAGAYKYLSYSSNKNGYITIYPALKDVEAWEVLQLENRSIEESFYANGKKTPYYVTSVSTGVNDFIIHNNSSNNIKFYCTNTHLDYDYQPYWRVNAIEQFRAGVVFDDEKIKNDYEDVCMAQVNDALTRLSGIISETSGNSVVFSVENLGVSKLYVDETIDATQQSGRYISSNKITTSSSKTMYYAKVSQSSIYRVSYGHDTLYYGKSVTSGSVTAISGTSSNLWYENVGYSVGVDENTLVVGDNSSGYYIISNSSFVLERVLGVSDCFAAYHNKYDDYDNRYNVLVRFGLDGTTWMGNQGIATSGTLQNEGGTSADINGQGKWINWLHYDSSSGVAWSYAIINVDTSDIFESLYHVIHEEVAQSLGIGDDCYSHEESIHWDPEYANPDWYTGIDKTILDFAYHKNLNGYTQFDLCNEFDLPITLFREYSEYNAATNSFQFHLKDAAGKWLLRSGEYEVYAWCTAMGSNGSGSIAGSGNDGWDDDKYSHRSTPLTLNITGGWYWSDYGIDMKKGLKVSDVHYTIWNSFCDAVKEVMPTGTIPNNETDYGSAANLSFIDAIEKAKATEDNKGLYAQRFNIVNYIIKQKVNTGIDVQKSLVSQVLAEYMIKLQDCRNLM